MEEGLREDRRLQEEALREDRRLHEEALREERRLQEATERRNNRIEVIREIGDLEKNIRRLINRSISEYNFSVVEEIYIALLHLNSALNRRILDWEELLDLDQSGNPVYPNRGQPEFCYSPEAEDFPNKTKIMEEVLTQAKEALMVFFKSLPAVSQVIVS